MKFKNYLLILGGFIVATASMSAQTLADREKILSKYDMNNLAELQVMIEEMEKKDYEEAVRLAQLNGWPLSYETEDGSLATLQRVLDGEFPMYYTTTNKNAAITIRVNKINTGGGAGLDLNGEDMLVGVWDEGLTRETHQLFEGRVEHQDGNSSYSDHATHVTGTVLGSADFQAGNAKGMAPAAEVYSWDWNSDASEAVQAIQNFGLLVSNHSYGYPAYNMPQWYLGKYDQTARTWDKLHFDAPYYLSFVAAGNDRGTANHGDSGFDLLTGFANSKNNVVVAGTVQVLNYNGPSSVVIYSSSSWGPTDDGRIKPDIAAKAVNTYSSVAKNPSPPYQLGDIYYSSYSGTSMAAPSMAGAGILLQQHANDVTGDFLRSASLRGLLIHTADEAGLHPGPDYRFGWGLANAERAAQVISDNGNNHHLLELEMDQDGFFQFSGTAVPGERVVVTICWTDKEGTVIPGQEEDRDDPRLINDLDLRVVDEGGTTHYPWILDHHDFTAAATTGDNYRDNVEKVEVDEASGTYRIRVSHKGELVGGPQKFSLIVSGIQTLTAGTEDIQTISAAVYPNPASDVLNIRSQHPISNVEIVNLLGQTISNHTVVGNSTTLDISSLQAGTYFAKVSMDGVSQVYKFVKK